MLIWMIYVVSVSLLLGAAALAAEYRARLRRTPSRWFWVLAIVASLLIPTVIASVSVQLPSIFSPAVSQKVVALREVTSARLSPSMWVGASSETLSTWRGIDPLLKLTWVVVSILMLVGLVISGVHLVWRKRRWAKGLLGGSAVCIAADVGPAVVGLFRPCIVVPTWLTHSPASQQTAVIAHEQSHIDAGDPQLLTVALCLLVLMPWNLPLWWQLRRLRYAIEVDCDARVLKGGQDAANYGETLIAVGERQSRYIGAVAAMSESKSFLEERIKIMVKKPAKWWRASAAVLGCVSLGLIAVAAQVEPPNATSPTGGHHQVELAPTVLESYTGFYQLAENVVMTVTRQGQQLSAQLTGQPAVEIYAESTAGFFSKIVNAQIDFLVDEQGRATALVLRQNGRNITASRIDAAVAQQITAAMATRVQSQTPMPGSEVAARRTMAAVAKGEPNYDEMSPELAELVRKQLPQLQATLTNLGAVVSVEFRGVGSQGWDSYEIRHERGISQLRIALNSNGLIAGAAWLPGP